MRVAVIVFFCSEILFRLDSAANMVAVLLSCQRCCELQCVAVLCGAVKCSAVLCSSVNCVAARHSVVQCVAVWCSVLQCGAVRSE